MSLSACGSRGHDAEMRQREDLNRDVARLSDTVKGGCLTETARVDERGMFGWLAIVLTLSLWAMPLSTHAGGVSSGARPELARAKTLARAGRHEAAIALLEARTREAPRDVEALFLLAGEYARAGRDAKAIETYQLVSALRPELAEPHANLAAIHLRKGELEAAAREMRLYLEHDPDSPVAHANLAWIYARLALMHYRKAEDHRPDPSWAARVEALERMLASPDSHGLRAGSAPASARTSP